MTADRAASTPVAAGPAPVVLAHTAESLVAELIRESAGQMSPSLYETARLVSLAPWLTGHAERVRHLLVSQRPDGRWGPPEGYVLVPTLSATEALLTELRTAPDAPDALAHAADGGLRALRRWLDVAWSVPDTPAIDLIEPALATAINGHLAQADLPPVLESPATYHRTSAPPCGHE